MAKTQARMGWMVLLLCMARGIHALEFDMLYQSKCLTDEIEKGVLVVGEYDAHDKNDHTKAMSINVKVGAET